MLLKRQEPFIRHWLQNETGLHTFKLLLLLWKANLHEMYSHTTGTWKCWTLPPFVVRTWGNSSYHTVNRIIKITHAHNLLNKIRFNNYNAYYAGRMYHVVHLLFFCFAGTKKKGLLNFVNERIIFLKLVIWAWPK